MRRGGGGGGGVLALLNFGGTCRTVLIQEVFRAHLLLNHSSNRSSSEEYKEAMEVISKLVSQHKSSLVPGEPQLNMCDKAVMVSGQSMVFPLFL